MAMAMTMMKMATRTKRGAALKMIPGIRMGSINNRPWKVIEDEYTSEV